MQPCKQKTEVSHDLLSQISESWSLNSSTDCSHILTSSLQVRSGAPVGSRFCRVFAVCFPSNKTRSMMSPMCLSSGGTCGGWIVLQAWVQLVDHPSTHRGCQPVLVHHPWYHRSKHCVLGSRHKK